MERRAATNGNDVRRRAANSAQCAIAPQLKSREILAPSPLLCYLKFPGKIVHLRLPAFVTTSMPQYTTGVEDSIQPELESRVEVASAVDRSLQSTTLLQQASNHKLRCNTCIQDRKKVGSKLSWRLFHADICIDIVRILTPECILRPMSSKRLRMYCHTA